GEQIAEADARGARRLGQEAVGGHARDRVHLERDHTVVRPHEIESRHTPAVESAVRTHREAWRALGRIRRYVGRTDLLALAGVVFRAVVEERALREDLDDR